MKRFIITSPRFTGEAEIHYNDKGVLVKIDVSQTSMTPGMIKTFKEQAPVLIDNVEQIVAGTQATIVQADLVVTFEMFWEAFDMKRNKKPAEDIWKKMSKQNQVIAYYSIKPYNKYCQRNTWYSKMYPDTYLRKQHFFDEWDKV